MPGTTGKEERPADSVSSLVTACVSCQRRLRLPESYLGKMLRCPLCATNFVAQRTGPAPKQSLLTNEAQAPGVVVAPGAPPPQRGKKTVLAPSSAAPDPEKSYRVACAHCQNPLRVLEHMLGRMLRCPTCKNTFEAQPQKLAEIQAPNVPVAPAVPAPPKPPVAAPNLSPPTARMPAMPRPAPVVLPPAPKAPVAARPQPPAPVAPPRATPPVAQAPARPAAGPASPAVPPAKTPAPPPVVAAPAKSPTAPTSAPVSPAAPAAARSPAAPASGGIPPAVIVGLAPGAAAPAGGVMIMGCPFCRRTMTLPAGGLSSAVKAVKCPHCARQFSPQQELPEVAAQAPKPAPPPAAPPLTPPPRVKRELPAVLSGKKKYVLCRKCTKPLRLPIEAIGQILRCPSCKQLTHCRRPRYVAAIPPLAQPGPEPLAAPQGAALQVAAQVVAAQAAAATQAQAAPPSPAPTSPAT
ncbi:MAG: hypothetical protein AB7K24_19685 [Gemmataceae bacterium]